MLEKTITYTDFDGESRTETHRFNLTKSEILEMEMGETGGMKKMLERIIMEKDGPKIMANFKEIILKAYGEKSADGRRFVKSKELSEAFSQTGAYDTLFLELVSDANAAAAFVNAVIPDVPSARSVAPSTASFANTPV